MRIRLIAIFGIMISGCATYTPTFPTTESADAESLHITPVLRQDEVAVQVVIADSSAATAQYGALGALFGALIDSAVNSSRAKKAERKAEVIRDAAIDYDLVAHLMTATNTESSGATWVRQSVGEVTGETKIRKLVSEVFAESDVDVVVVLTGSYQLTPAVDQVHVSISQQVYPRWKIDRSKGPVQSNGRHLAYQSPPHPIAFRPFRDGEKEQLKSAIRLEYEQSIAIQPDNEDALRKSLESELEEIEERTEIPEDRAIAETWTPDLLHKYLDEAKSHLRFMLEYDWNEQIKPDMKTDSLEPFFAVTATGVRSKLKGRNVGRLDQNVIYRTAYGILYSVPPAEL